MGGKMIAARRAWTVAVLAAALALGAEAGQYDPVPMNGADVTAHDVAVTLFKAKAGAPIDYSNHKLMYLDLSGLDFKGARFTHADLYGTDFTGANLKGTDLSHTRLDRSVLIQADLSGADLTGATIFRPTVYTDLSNNLGDAPRFAGANLTSIRVMADLSGAYFRGAKTGGIMITPLPGATKLKPGSATRPFFGVQTALVDCGRHIRCVPVPASCRE
jgi:Pentapeptide repeats (8 copies)